MVESGASNELVTAWLAEFGGALAAGDSRRAAALFGEESYWRDLVSFTWNITTVEGPAAIEAMLRATLPATQPGGWSLVGDATTTGDVTEAWLTFETAVARGFGHIRLKGRQCYTLLTTAKELKGFEERRGPTRERGTEHGAIKNRKTWLERRRQDEAELGYDVQPYCVIVGGGQGGIGLAARLKQLGVPTIVIEKNERAGDSWRKRYKSLCLHDAVWYDHMPYLPFPDHWPIFTPKDKLGDWLEMYVKVMELDYWTGATCLGAEFDSGRKEWVLRVDRAGTPVVLRPQHLVLATGMSGFPNLPEFPGARDFKGEQHHSSRHDSGERYAGKKCVVVGANNSAHDICADLWEHGADVTMIQRSSTLVARSETLMELSSGRLYSEAALKRGITTEKADLMFASIPHRVLPEIQRPIFAEMARRDAGFYERLTKAGFMLDFGEDDFGPLHEISASRLGLLHRCRGLGLNRSRRDQAQERHRRGSPHRPQRRVQQRKHPAGRSRRLCHRLRLDEPVGGTAHLKHCCRQGRQMLGTWLRDHLRPWSLGRGIAQHVEADATGGAVVSRRKPGAVALLLAVPVAPAKGPHGAVADAGLWPRGDAPPAITTATSRRTRRAASSTASG